MVVEPQGRTLASHKQSNPSRRAHRAFEILMTDGHDKQQSLAIVETSECFGTNREKTKPQIELCCESEVQSMPRTCPS